MLFLLLFSDKTVVHITNLLEPPPMYRLREVDDNFVTKMKATPGIQLGYNKTVFPVVVAGSGPYVSAKARSYTYFTLGGNHLRETLQSLHQQKELSKEKQWVNIVVFRYA